MDADRLLLEIGSEAYNELTDDERTSLLNSYTNAQSKLAGMRAFELLMKKFQPTYRMGRMYEDLSAKYEHYRRMYMMYAQAVKAGKLGKTVGDERNIQRYKFLEQTHPEQQDAD